MADPKIGNGFTHNFNHKGGVMKIKVEKNLVELVPESDDETKQMLKLWNTIVDCVKFNKKLVPIGEYVPQKSNLARFAIEDK
jgi:hypothetical protein